METHITTQVISTTNSRKTEKKPNKSHKMMKILLKLLNLVSHQEVNWV